MRIFRALLPWIIALVAGSAHALDTPLLSGGAVIPSAATTSYSYFNSNPLGFQTTAEVNGRTLFPVAGTLKTLYVDVDTAPGAGKNYAFTIMKNGVATGLGCTLADTNTRCTDLNNSVSIVAGDSLSIRSVPTGTPGTPTNFRVGSIFSTAGTDGVILGCTRQTVLSTTTTEYGYIGGCNANNATLNIRDSPVPVGGTIDKFYVELSGAPGVGSGYTATILKNGIATALTCNIVDTATSCSDTVNSVSVVSGDLLAIQYSIQSGTPVGPFARHALRWTPTVAGQIVLMHNTANAMNNAGAARFSAPMAGGSGWNSSELPVRVVMPGAYLWKNFVVILDTAPGVGTGYTLRNRVNAGFGNLSVSIVDANTTGSDTSNSSNVVAGDLIDAYSISTGAPASSIPKFGWTLEPVAQTSVLGRVSLLGVGK